MIIHVHSVQSHLQGVIVEAGKIFSIDVNAAEKIASSGKKNSLTGVNIGDFGSGNDDSFIDLINELNKVRDRPD